MRGDCVGSARREGVGSGRAGAAGEVAVVGAINVDFVVVASRLPGRGETVTGDDLALHGGGKGANAAVAAARAGATARLIGAVGADEHGKAALADLHRDGVIVEDVAVLDGHSTGAALIVVDAAGDNQIAVAAGANSALTAAHVESALRRLSGRIGCVLVSTEIGDAAVVAAVAAAGEIGARCILNPAPVSPAVLSALGHHPLLTPNAIELAELSVLVGDGSADSSGNANGLHDVAARATRVAAAAKAPVVVTLGGDGALLLTQDGTPERISAPPAEVRDTTGAGDTYNGVLAARLAAGDPLRDAARVATVAASLSVVRAGARDGMPSAAEIEAALRAASPRG